MYKLLAKKGLKINAGELDVLQSLEDRGWTSNLYALIKDFGIIVHRDDNDKLDNDLQVYDAGGQSIGIRAGAMFNNQKQFVEIPADITPVPDVGSNPIPDDSTDYNINLGHQTVEQQPGTLSVTTSDDTVVGVGTEFTKYLTAGMKFLIAPADTSQGNDGTFTVISVTDDLNLEVSGIPFTTETLIKFSVVGTFATGFPIGNANIIQNDFYTVHIETAAPGTGEITLAIVNRTGSVVTITDNRANNVLALKPRISDIVTDVAPKPPLDLSIFDISPITEQFSKKISRVTFEWNYYGLVGIHYVGDGVDTIRVEDFITGTHRQLNVTAGQLIGYYLYSTNFAPADNRYLIVGNGATSGGDTVITLESAYADESMVDPGSPGSIILDADTIELKVETYDNAGGIPVIELSDDYILNDTLLAGGNQKKSVDMNLFRFGGQAYYTIYVRSIRNKLKSAWQTMAAGDYDPDHATGGQGVIAYGSPFKNILPNLDTAFPGTLSPTTNQFGFRLLATGYDDGMTDDGKRHEFEYAWSRNAAPLVFDDLVNTQRARQRSGVLQVTVPQQGELYQVGMRPLQNRQVVGAVVTASIVSGSGGIIPSDSILASVDVNLKTFDGTLVAGLGDPLFRIDDVTLMHSPNGGGATDLLDDRDELMMYLMTTPRVPILVDSAGEEFRVTSIFHGVAADAMEIRLENMSGASFVPQVGAFTINTSKRGRLLLKKNALEIEYELKRLYLEATIVRGATSPDPGVIRAYQNAGTGESDADQITFFADDSEVDQAIDVEVKFSVGVLNIIVDAWDSSGTPNNDANVKGRVELYAAPLAKKQSS